jgi:hypothetical protein
MSGHDAHGAAEGADEVHHAHAPGLPEVHDEAGDTPMWVPILGAVLLVLGGFWVVYKVATFGADEAAAAGDGGVTDGATDGDVADAGLAAAPSPQ